MVAITSLDGNESQTPSSPEPVGQRQQKRYQEYHLAGEAEEYRLPGFADRLEESCGHDLEADRPECEQRQRERSRGDRYQCRVGGECAGYESGHSSPKAHPAVTMAVAAPVASQ